MNNFDNFFDNLFPLRPLFPFVQSVLPTVFDDSLSYLETLGKVVKALNDTESNVNTLEQAVRAFADDLAEYENLAIYPVSMTFNENTGNYTADKTFADIDAALLEGRTPVLHVLDRDGRNYYSAQLAKAGNTIFYWTTPLFYEDGDSVIFRAFINSSDVSGVIASPLDSGAVVVNYTTVSGSDIPVVDKTFEQISAALEDNKPVFLFVDNAYWVPLSRANRSGNDVDGYHYISAEFIYAIPVSTTGGNNLGVGVYSVNSSDVWSMTRYAFPDAGRVNTLIDIKLAQLEGFESVKKLYYNENTGAVVIWDGEHMSPITGEEIIINILSATNIFPFMQGQGAVTDVFNCYVPLKYDASSANEAVQFYRFVNNNLEIVSIPRDSNIATKSIVNVGVNPTPEEIAAAVSEWLDDNVNPVGSAVVVDSSLAISGAAADAKVTGDKIGGKAPAIWESIVGKNSFSEEETSECDYYKLTFPQTQGVETVYVAPCEDVLPNVDAKTFDNGFWSLSGNTAIADGTGNGNFAFCYVNNSSSIVPKKPIRANDVVTLRLARLSGSITPENDSYTYPMSYSFKLTYTDNTSLSSGGGEFPVNGLYHEVSLTAEKDVSRISITFYARPHYTFSELTLRFALIVNSEFASYELTNNLEISKNILGANGIAILPVNGTLNRVVDTKEYIDSYIPEGMLTNNDLVYVTPEMFESHRTSSNDDYAVLTACLTYAINNNVPVRGFGSYTISRGIELECDDIDIFINNLTITSASTAAVVKLTGYRNKIRINKINAYGMRMIGFWLYGKNSHWSEFNTIHLPCIYAGNDAIFVSTESESAYACENLFYVQNINSGYENCIHIVNGYGENTFFGGGGHVTCQSGWAIKLTNSGGNKFYDFALEGHVKSGIYLENSSGNFISGFRIAELRGQKTPTSGDIGTVVKFVGCSNSNYFECSEGMNMVDIDVTEAKSNDELTAAEVETAYSFNVFNVNGVRGSGYNWANGVGYYALYGKELLVLQNKKIAVPLGIMQTDVESNIAYGVDEGRDILFNWFTMKTNADITLCDSYCPIGFNEIYIDQTDGKATVYKNGSIIFNGSNFGNGIYKLICYCDTKNNIHNSIHSDTKAAFYDGDNEVWIAIPV